MQLEIEISQQELAKELGYVKSLCRESHQVVALSGENGALTLAASDGRIYLTSRIDAKVLEDGEILVRTDRLFDVVKALPRGVVRLRRDQNGALSVSGGDFTAALPLGVVFPSLPNLETPNRISLQASELEGLVNRTKFVLGYGKGQFAQGALAEIQSEATRFVSTDGHRLAIATTGPFKDGESVTRLVLPTSGVDKLSDLLPEHQGEVRLDYGDRHFGFEIGRRRLAGTLCPWQYPDYKRIMPKEHKSEAILSVAGLRVAVRRATLLAPDPEVVMEFGAGEVRVTGGNDDEDERASDTLEACIQGEPSFRVKLNSNYLMEAVVSGGAEKIRMRFFGPGAGITVQPEGVVSPRSEFLIMPMRL